MSSAKTFQQLIADCRDQVAEVFPWELLELMEQENVLLLDVREPAEFTGARLEHSVNVPRGVLEAASEYGYEETEPALARSRERTVVVVCRSGNRSLLAGLTLQQLGFERVLSLKTGLRGWNDYELPLLDAGGDVLPLERADDFFAPAIRPEQLAPTETA